MAKGKTQRYRYTSNKNAHDGTNRIQVDENRWADVGGEIDLTDAEAARLRKRVNLTNVTESSSSTTDDSGSS
jgi:hypothetical protein